MSADLIPPDRLPPQSQEAEMGVLGSVLRDNAVLSDVLQVIRPDNFYFDAHQKIFQATIDLYNDGKPIDLVILFERLKQLKLIEDVGGIRVPGRAVGGGPDGGQRRVLRPDRPRQGDGPQPDPRQHRAAPGRLRRDDAGGRAARGGRAEDPGDRRAGHDRGDAHPGQGAQGRVRPDRQPDREGEPGGQRDRHRVHRPGQHHRRACRTPSWSSSRPGRRSGKRRSP